MIQALPGHDTGVHVKVSSPTAQRHVEDMYLIGGNTGSGWLRSVDIFTVRPPACRPRTAGSPPACMAMAPAGPVSLGLVWDSLAFFLIEPVDHIRLSVHLLASACQGDAAPPAALGCCCMARSAIHDVCGAYYIRDPDPDAATRVLRECAIRRCGGAPTLETRAQTAQQGCEEDGVTGAVQPPGKWRKGADMPEARGYGALAAIPGSLLYLGGGNGTSWMSSVLRYDISADSWSNVGHRPPIHLLTHPQSRTASPAQGGTGCCFQQGRSRGSVNVALFAR